MKKTKLDYKPWEEYPHIWKTQAAFMSFIRGGVRRGLWEKNPIKLEFIKKNRVRVPLGKKTKSNPEGIIWGAICHKCKKSFKQAECQVDHDKGGHSLKSFEDLLDFIKSIVLIREEDLRIICKQCHKIKSYSEKNKISFRKADTEKQLIAFFKENTPEQQKEFLIKKGFKIDQLRSIDKRKEAYRKCQK